jgi:LuxR family maltose regulon positive regulatory protein
MERLLRKVHLRGILPSYTQQLLTLLQNGEKAVSGAGAHDPSTALIRPSLYEPLSQREREVLGLLVTSLSSTEIAEHLYISVNTVRSHIRSIYGKLDVHSRFEAVARAQELQLL